MEGEACVGDQCRRKSQPDHGSQRRLELNVFQLVVEAEGEVKPDAGQHQRVREFVAAQIKSHRSGDEPDGNGHPREGGCDQHARCPEGAGRCDLLVAAEEVDGAQRQICVEVHFHVSVDLLETLNKNNQNDVPVHQFIDLMKEKEQQIAGDQFPPLEFIFHADPPCV